MPLPGRYGPPPVPPPESVADARAITLAKSDAFAGPDASAVARTARRCLRRRLLERAGTRLVVGGNRHDRCFNRRQWLGLHLWRLGIGRLRLRFGDHWLLAHRQRAVDVACPLPLRLGRRQFLLEAAATAASARAWQGEKNQAHFLRLYRLGVRDRRRLTQAKRRGQHDRCDQTRVQTGRQRQGSLVGADGLCRGAKHLLRLAVDNRQGRGSRAAPDRTTRAHGLRRRQPHAAASSLQRANHPRFNPRSNLDRRRAGCAREVARREDLGSKSGWVGGHSHTFESGIGKRTAVTQTDRSD